MLSHPHLRADDVVAQYGAREPATAAERADRTGLLVSVQPEIVTGARETGQQQVEWLHVMAQGVSNQQHWLPPAPASYMVSIDRRFPQAHRLGPGHCSFSFAAFSRR